MRTLQQRIRQAHSYEVIDALREGCDWIDSVKDRHRSNIIPDEFLLPCLEFWNVSKNMRLRVVLMFRRPVFGRPRRLFEIAFGYKHHSGKIGYYASILRMLPTALPILHYAVGGKSAAREASFQMWQANNEINASMAKDYDEFPAEIVKLINEANSNFAT
ncbi:hypothetical protein [Fuerstiella marisgermanici]|uniref:Uncharacterized protein n=1 Tax=Fuerstiella marisgermanici TaxID=1891926 RepID=A0A1P8W997_9PLAN|nr:hypothetical protein [Fuerstiella marisgermanici]APZ90637.1 hypothetical protein Fuma_00218 [Fuerstiella marisgermanici]